MLVENNIYIYIYHPRDVCAIENAVAILPLIYKKWSQENLKGKKNGNQSLVPNYFFLGLSYKNLLIKKKKKITQFRWNLYIKTTLIFWKIHEG